MPTPTTPPSTDLDYQLLKQLVREPAASQRSLAVQLGVSVGKVNFCMRALVDRGWVKAQNFLRSDNKWAYVYLLTPHGVKARLQLTREFLVRKEVEFEALKRQIHDLRDELDTPHGPPQAADEPLTIHHSQPSSTSPARADPS